MPTPEPVHPLVRPPEHEEPALALKSLKLSASMRVLARWWLGQPDAELPCDPPPGAPAACAGWEGFK